jgi:hypothetical protein
MKNFVKYSLNFLWAHKTKTDNLNYKRMEEVYFFPLTLLQNITEKVGISKWCISFTERKQYFAVWKQIKNIPLGKVNSYIYLLSSSGLTFHNLHFAY